MARRSSILDEIVGRIVGIAHPIRVVLFGSRARGEGRVGSDFDLLVVADSSEPRYRRSAPLYAGLADIPAEVDVVVYTPDEIEAWRNVPESLSQRAMTEGVVLYDQPG